MNIVIRLSKEEIKKALGNTKVYSYGDLYHKLGLDEISKRYNAYDVHYMYINTKLNKYIYDVLMNRNLHRKSDVIGMLKPSAKANAVTFDHMNYSPKDDDNIEGIEVRIPL